VSGAVISAVGHEVDVTIADLVADLRAPTPSAAAEHAVPDGTAIRQDLRLHRTRLGRALRMYAASRRERISRARERLGDRIRRLAGRRRDELGLADERLRRHTRRMVESKRALLARLAAKVDALSPLQSLARGYAVPLAEDGRILRRRSEFAPGRPFRLRILDGSVPCRVEEEGDTADG
jgi:exodeoxyribonuclease VII large subunit